MIDLHRGVSEQWMMIVVNPNTHFLFGSEEPAAAVLWPVLVIEPSANGRYAQLINLVQMHFGSRQNLCYFHRFSCVKLFLERKYYTI